MERVLGYLQAGHAEEKRAMPAFHKRVTLEPTALTDTKQQMKVVREEILGPAVPAIRFEDVEELLPRANDTVNDLAAGIWTRDIGKAHRLASALHAGTVWIHCYNIFDAALPLGG